MRWRIAHTCNRVQAALRPKNAGALGLPIAIAFTLSGACAPASAGHYSGPTYSGGEAWIPGSPPHYTPYGASNGGWGGASGGGGSPWTGTCHGAITTVFSWVRDKIQDPNDPNQQIDDPLDDPPDQVIITETSAVSLAANAYGNSPSASGTLNTGLQQANGPVTIAPIFTAVPYPPYVIIIGQSATGSCTATRYTLRAGGASVQLDGCSPLATSTSSGGPATSQVTYTAVISPVVVTLSGLTRSADQSSRHVLTGQRVTAQLSAGFPVKNDANNKPMIAWTPPADVFKDFLETANANPLKLLTDDDKKQLTLNFYTKTQSGGLQASCTATLQFPDGAILAGGLPAVTATSNTFTSDKPTVTAWLIQSGAVDYVSFSTQYGYFGANGSPQGQFWSSIRIVVQPPFDKGPDNEGHGCLAQVVTSKRTNTRIARHDPPYNPQSVDRYVNQGLYGVGALDSGFPYSYGASVQWEAKNGRGSGYDSPFHVINPRDVDNGGTNWTAATAEDSFTTWVMYQPPSNGNGATKWVPLASHDWGWSGTAENLAPWALTARSQNSGGYTPTDTHPTWLARAGSPVLMGPP